MKELEDVDKCMPLGVNKSPNSSNEIDEVPRDF